MPPDASATKRRILDAARTEFARFGLAGARVDRIAETAEANKRSIYVHFGPKEHLFDLVVIDALTVMAAEVPFDADDLPGYAGRLFDHLRDHPETLRLSLWANLERPTATAVEEEAYRGKAEALRPAFGASAPDVLAFLLSVVTAGATASPALLLTDGGDIWSEGRRALVIAAADGLIARLREGASAD